MDFEQVLSWAIPSTDECRQRVKQLQAAHPHLDPEQLAEKVVHSTRRSGAAAGAATGVLSNPVAMVPAAFGEFGLLMHEEGKMIGVIAALLDPESLDDYETFKGDILAVLFPVAVTQALQQMGVRAGQQTTKVLIRKYISKGLLAALKRWILRYLGIKLTQKMLISKTLPVVGAGIGAGWNWVEVKVVGARAMRYYRGRAVGATASGEAVRWTCAACERRVVQQSPPGPRQWGTCHKAEDGNHDWLPEGGDPVA